MKYTLSLYEKAMPDGMPLNEKLLATRACGYDGMELCVDLNPEREARLNWTARERREISTFLIDNGMRIPTFSLSALRACPLGELDAAKNARALDMLEKSAWLCCEIGSHIILINGYDVYFTPSTPQTVERFGENIAKAAELCASYGVTLAIENAERPFIDRFGKAAQWVRHVDSPYLRIYGDIGNTFNAYEGDISHALMDFETGRGITAAVHLKDTLPGEYRFTRYGEGHVDFAQAVKKCLDIGVRLFTAELFYQEQLDWRGEASRVNTFLRGFFPA
ncbi:MAG TPA: L-ribulose-5-phosphate 3-epimerase [Feifaniaceae bacterium]|nr:L-ribulose-5-phosphate 3-epimerase [Feifaniaceae bacterium]